MKILLQLLGLPNLVLGEAWHDPAGIPLENNDPAAAHPLSQALDKPCFKCTLKGTCNSISGTYLDTCLSNNLDLLAQSCTNCHQLLEYSSIVKYITGQSSIDGQNRKLVGKVINNIVRENTTDTFIFSLCLDKDQLEAFLANYHDELQPNGQNLAKKMGKILANWGKAKALGGGKAADLSHLYQTALKIHKMDELGPKIHELNRLKEELLRYGDALVAPPFDSGVIKEFYYSIIISCMDRDADDSIQEQLSSLIRGTIDSASDLRHPVLRHILEHQYHNKDHYEAGRFKMIRFIFDSQEEGIEAPGRYVQDPRLIPGLKTEIDWILSMQEARQNPAACLEDRTLIAMRAVYERIRRCEFPLEAALNFYEVMDGRGFLHSLRDAIYADIGAHTRQLSYACILKSINLENITNKERMYDIIFSQNLDSKLEPRFYQFVNIMSCFKEPEMATLALCKMFEHKIAGPDCHDAFMERLISRLNDEDTGSKYYFLYTEGYAFYIAREHMRTNSVDGLEEYLACYRECLAKFAVRINTIWKQPMLCTANCTLYGLNLYICEVIGKETPVICPRLPKPPSYEGYLDITILLLISARASKYQWIIDTIERKAHLRRSH